MAITSQITARAIFGQDPSGFTPLIPQNGGGDGYFMSSTKQLQFNYGSLTFGANIPATQAAFLAMVKDEFDSIYLPTILTDATKNYEVEIQVSNVRLDFVTQTGDRSIWTERKWYFFVDTSFKVNVV